MSLRAGGRRFARNLAGGLARFDAADGGNGRETLFDEREREMAKQKSKSDTAYETALQRIEECRKKQIFSLDLSGLGLTTIPTEIGQLNALTSLNLSRNQLTTIPNEIGQLNALTSLDLAGNQLTTIPNVIGQLNALTSLNLSGNQLTTIPNVIGQLNALTSLHLWGNQLTTIPNVIGQLNALTWLDLSDNQLTTIPNVIGQLNALTSLYLSDNQLTAIPNEIGQLNALTTLNLSDNQLTTIPSEIGQLNALTSLDLSRNQLTTIPSEIGQLNALTSLDLSRNQLTTIPNGIGQLNALKRLWVLGNPLPEELLALSGGPDQGDGTKLIAFLRARAAAEKGRRFDEAKLLLVGPGEVGKTWLLHALQGKVPKKVDTTKGIEIAREPLDVPHPTEKGRTLHLTCWDFGGQEHFQVTHQIFFSAKAVYLLVWKPREGFDPEMEARLERIQLSAGRSAKVLIVSTHADGKVPAVIGQDALQERFGDLIGGFFQIDSAKGPNGTGIAALKREIARIAAGLDGMDLDFPETWHAAQQALRKIDEPAVPFKRIVKECAQHGLDAGTADTIAQLMEVQGHAVYFPEAATDEEAGALAGENLVVLNPEWLAKAVGFVIEDKDTIAAQGILIHKQLSQIWRKDDSRDCPGYKKALRGFLLWLMWKFDIAYKQDAETSLVPELIARNRPDDLLWNPHTPSQSPEVRAVCVFTSEQTKKVIATPKGMMPALTAAVHPLRKRHESADPDKLDRNWNSGFFLHTQSRGDAYVELIDRELRLVVRHDYPSLLLRQVQKTLEGLVPQRWPHAVLDLRVPCHGKVDGRPCPQLFKMALLDKQPLNGTISCPECFRTDLKVADLLEGFHPRDEEILARLRDLQDGQQDLLAVAHSLFMALDPLNEERRRGPSLFTILPEQGRWLSGMTHDHVRLTCWCEHPDGPHPGSYIGSNEPPDYVLKVPKEWLVKAGPYISWAVTLLKAFTPLAADMAGQIAGNAGMEIKDAVALMKDSASSLPSGKLEIGEGRAFEVEPGARWGDAYGRQSRPELTALRHIHDLLEEQVPKPKRWGKLFPVRTKSGEILWLCPQHAAIQSPPVQQL
jgi:Leucine-rich repeat (LRR) protein